MTLPPLQLPTRVLSLAEPVVMGILNRTPDSFSDGGRHAALADALAHALAMVADGAGIIDVGGESTRPGAAPVGEAEELDRVVPLIEALRRESDVVISIDTMKPAVMREACAAGAEIINDVYALQAPGAVEAAVASGAAVCLMHMQGEPRTMQAGPHYDDVVNEVRGFLAARVAVCREAGIARERICLDPGIGFGKRLDHNLALLGGVAALALDGYPWLYGVSRKSMFGQLLGRPVDERLPAALAAAAIAVWQGAAIVRTHDVRATVDAVRVAVAARDAGQNRKNMQ
ncbi:dihydropteroate synthase [Solimonas marina]|uniref:dihydropteroate synthase n=1 Tax=Solimonas marina TaxID=2714601 RepID=UPI0019CFE92C|nr:dihydropteroate synthase [Solimonas marina]